MVVDEGQGELGEPANEEDLLGGGNGGIGQRVKTQPDVKYGHGLRKQAEDQVN